MRTLNVAANRDLLEKCVNLEHQIQALKKHEEQLNNLMSGEPVELSEKAKNTFKKAVVIGQARRGGLQTNYAAQLEIFKHRCEKDRDQKSKTFGQCLIRHLDGWTADGPTEEQREKAWMNAQGIREQIDRITWDLENVRKQISECQNELDGAVKEFTKTVFEVAKMSLTAGS